MANSIVSGKSSPAEVDLTSPQTLANKTIGTSSIHSPSRLDVKKDTVANLATYASSAAEGQLCYSTDTDKLYVIKSNSLKELNDSKMDLIATVTVSNASNVTFSSISNTIYDSYRIVVSGAVPVTNAVNLLLRISNSATFQTSGYSWQNFRITTSGSGVTGQTSSGTGIPLNAAGADNISNSSTNGGSWFIDIANCQNTNADHVISYQGYYLGSARLHITGSGVAPSQAAIDGFQFLMDSGNISKGTFTLYGYKNS